MYLNRYSMVKLFLFFVVCRLVEFVLLEKIGVVLNYSDLGLCWNIGFVWYVDLMFKILIKVFYIFIFWSVEMGSCVLFYVIVIGKESYGKFVENCNLE